MLLQSMEGPVCRHCCVPKLLEEMQTTQGAKMLKNVCSNVPAGMGLNDNTYALS